MITTRPKDVPSLRRKIDSKPGRYSRLTDITDLVGVRVILYFEDQINKVRDIVLESEIFDQDYENMQNKMIETGDQFGYRSLHLILSLNYTSKSETTSPLLGKKFELQIRTILNHSWAEITHDIGYKPLTPIAEDTKRKMFRIAALLETADKMFMEARNESEQFIKDFEKQESTPGADVPITGRSLNIYLLQENPLTEFENRICEYYGRSLNKTVFPDYIDDHAIDILDAYSLRNLQDINNFIGDYEKELEVTCVEKFCGERASKDYNKYPKRGFLLWHIVHLIHETFWERRKK